MAQLLAAGAVRANGRPARARVPPGRLVMGPDGLPTTDHSYRHEVYVSPAFMRNLYSSRPATSKRRRLPPAAAPEQTPDSEGEEEAGPPSCSVCLEDIDACSRAVGCPKCSTLLCLCCNTKYQEGNLRTQKPMNQCPTCRQDVIRMVEKEACFATTGKPYEPVFFLPAQPATCILCKQELGSSGFGCRACVDFTACEGCFEKMQSMQRIYAKYDQPDNFCPCCKQPAGCFVRYPQCMHATGVKPKRESCSLCTRALGYEGDMAVRCPLCNKMKVHQDCWAKYRLGNVKDGLPENQCHFCGEDAEMLLYEL